VYYICARLAGRRSSVRFTSEIARILGPKLLLLPFFLDFLRFCKIKVHIPCFFVELLGAQNQISLWNCWHFYVKHVTDHTSAALGTKVKDIQLGRVAYFCTSHSATPTTPRRKNVSLLCLWLHKYMKNWCSKKYVDKTIPQESHNSRRIDWIQKKLTGQFWNIIILTWLPGLQEQNVTKKSNKDWGSNTNKLFCLISLNLDAMLEL